MQKNPFLLFLLLSLRRHPGCRVRFILLPLILIMLSIKEPLRANRFGAASLGPPGRPAGGKVRGILSAFFFVRSGTPNPRRGPVPREVPSSRWARGVEHRSRRARAESSCSGVRGPTTGAVTAGWCSSQASATSPGSRASSPAKSSNRRICSRCFSRVARDRPRRAHAVVPFFSTPPSSPPCRGDQG